MNAEVLALARELIGRRSITPDDAGCQDVIAERLAAIGLDCELLPAGKVKNLWACAGTPRLCFAGHTDVVPAGPEALWSHPPFVATERDGLLFGRGAADMKGSLAAMVVAAERFACRRGSVDGLCFLITSDEEGLAVHGTRHVVRTLQERGTLPAWCVVGEPSSRARPGDVVRIGRRGSLTGRLTVRGVQGHVAYPELAVNPIHCALAALKDLAGRTWSPRNPDFPPTGLQLVELHAGVGAENVIPGELVAIFNLRYNPALDEADLSRDVEAVLREHRLDYHLDWHLSDRPFITRGGPLVAAMDAAIEATTGVRPRHDTGGGTSDGRFIAPAGVDVVELGPVNASIHKVDEHVAVTDLGALVDIHVGVMERLLAGATASHERGSG